MDIIQIIPDSFQEYAGEHSLVVFTPGCNLDCVNCYNKAFTNLHTKGTSFDEVLKKSLTPLHTAVVFLGGEPTLQGNSLIHSVEKVRHLGLKTKVYTNGMLPGVIEQLIDIVDAWSVDFKGVVNLKNIVGREVGDWDYLFRLTMSLMAIKASGAEFELRTTMFSDDVIRQMPDIESYIKNLLGAKTKWIVQEKFLPGIYIKEGE